MAKDKYYGKTLRKNFARHEEVMAMPDLLEIQKKSYKWFLDTGLREVFADVASITDYAGNLELSFIDYSMDEKPKYDVEECKARDATYAAPMKVRVHRHLLCRQGADRHQILASGQQRAYLVVARIADHGDVVIVAYAVAAACPFDELEQQVVGDGCNRFGLGHAASPEEDAFGHRPRAVYGQDECRAVVACDALCIHVASI